MESIEKRLKRARKKAGLTQTDAAKLCGISPRAIVNYEQDASRITIRLMHIFAEVYKVSLTWLFFGEGETFYYALQEQGELEQADEQKKQQPGSNAKNNDTAIEAEHIELIKKFKNKELAKDLGYYMLRLEQDDAGSLRELKGYLSRMIEEAVSTTPKIL